MLLVNYDGITEISEVANYHILWERRKTWVEEKKTTDTRGFNKILFRTENE